MARRGLGGVGCQVGSEIRRGGRRGVGYTAVAAWKRTCGTRTPILPADMKSHPLPPVGSHATIDEMDGRSIYEDPRSKYMKIGAQNI